MLSLRFEPITCYIIPQQVWTCGMHIEQPCNCFHCNLATHTQHADPGMIFDVLGDQQIVTLSDAENKRHSNSPLLQSITNPEQDSSVTSSILRSNPKSNTEYASCHSIAGHA